MRQIRINILKCFAIIFVMLFIMTGCAQDVPLSSVESSEPFSTETEAETPEQKTTDGNEEGAALFAEIQGKCFTFSSGAGGWATSIEMKKDGSFRGYYSDSELGETGQEYPNGTVYECGFNGNFTFDKKIDDYTYSLILKNIKTVQPEGVKTISEGIRYVTAKPYGFETGKEFQLYAPGHPVSSLKTEYLDWINRSFLSGNQLEVWGLYNTEPEYGFYEDTEAYFPDQKESKTTDGRKEDDESKESQKKDKSSDKSLQTPVIGKWTHDTSGIDADGVNVSWSKVEGAQKYEVQFFFIANGNSTPLGVDETKDTNATTFFQEIGDAIGVQVRAVGTKNGQKIYSEWADGEISKAEVERITADTDDASKGRETKESDKKSGSEGVISESKAVSLVKEEVADDSLITGDVKIIDQNEGAYLVSADFFERLTDEEFQEEGTEYGPGGTNVYRVDKTTGEVSYIDGANDFAYTKGMYDF